VARLSDDCFAHAGILTGLDAALDDLLGRLVPVAGRETLPLSACAGRALAAPMAALHAVPPHDNSAVDGYAVFHADLSPDDETRLPLAGRAAAGHPLAGGQRRGTAVQVLTGAAMPAGADGAPGPDTVLMQEDCRPEEDAVVIPPGIARGANRRATGEDVGAGAPLLAAGRRLTPADLALAAAAGHAALPVFRPLKVALLSTGDELREAGTALPPGAIHDANRPLLAALLARAGCAVDDLGIQPDRTEALAGGFAAAARDHDVIVASGGVSGGAEDHVKAAIAAAGGRLHLWRLAIRPGKPVALGQIGAVPVFGLPGNPVAAALTFAFFAGPLLQRLGGCDPSRPRGFPVVADFACAKKPGRREWLRVSLRPDGQGGWLAQPYPVDGAGILTSLTRSDGVIELAEGSAGFRRGDRIAFYGFGELGL
jgi:molybdopterin molybdotransferase